MRTIQGEVKCAKFVISIFFLHPPNMSDQRSNDECDLRDDERNCELNCEDDRNVVTMRGIVTKSLVSNPVAPSSEQHHVAHVTCVR